MKLAGSNDIWMHISPLNLTQAVDSLCSFLDRTATIRARERLFSQLQSRLQRMSLAISLLSTAVAWEGATREASLQPHSFINTECRESRWESSLLLGREVKQSREPSGPVALLGGGSLFKCLSTAWERAVQLDFLGISVPSCPSPQIPVIYAISSCVIPLIL